MDLLCCCTWYTLIRTTQTVVQVLLCHFRGLSTSQDHLFSGTLSIVHQGTGGWWTVWLYIWWLQFSCCFVNLFCSKVLQSVQQNTGIRQMSLIKQQQMEQHTKWELEKNCRAVEWWKATARYHYIWLNILIVMLY